MSFVCRKCLRELNHGRYSVPRISPWRHFSGYEFLFSCAYVVRQHTHRKRGTHSQGKYLHGLILGTEYLPWFSSRRHFHWPFLSFLFSPWESGMKEIASGRKRIRTKEEDYPGLSRKGITRQTVVYVIPKPQSACLFTTGIPEFHGSPSSAG